MNKTEDKPEGVKEEDICSNELTEAETQAQSQATEQAKAEVSEIKAEVTERKKEKSKASKICGYVGFFALLALTVALTVNSLLCIFVKHYYPTFGDYRLFAIVSDSMEPEIPTGDMIVGRVPQSESEIEVGTVLTYEYPQGNNSYVLITHRVTAITVDANGVTHYTMRGDNAEGVDNYRPVFDDVVGIYTGNKCGFFGYFFGFLQSSEGAITLIIILLIIAITWIVVYFVHLVNIWRNVALDALKKSGSILNQTKIAELGTIADVIGIVSKDPEGKGDIKRKDEKLNWFVQMNALPKRPYPDDLEEYLKQMGDSLKPVPVPRLKYADDDDTAVKVVEVEKIVEVPVEKVVEVPVVQEQTVVAEQPAPEGEEADEADDELAIAELAAEEEDGEVTEEIVINGKTVRYNRSFEARIIQSSDEVKARYSRLKNYMLSYKGVKNRISWKKESFRLGRNAFAVFTVRGKTLCLSFATDPKRFDDTKYHVIDMSVRSPKSKQPCLYRINGERKAKYAEEIVDLLMAELGVFRVEGYQDEAYTPVYRATPALIACGLIKVIGDAEALDFGESESALLEELAVEEEEGAEVAEEVVIDGKVVRYNRSFEARIIQSSDELKARYSLLKNTMLSYAGVKSRMSWKKEAFRKGRVTVATLTVRGKTLCLSLAVDPKSFEGTKYKVIDMSVRSPRSKQPCLYRINGERKTKFAAELIDLVFAEYGAALTEREKENFVPPFEETEPLIERGLIRVIDGTGKQIAAPATVAEAQTDGADPVVAEPEEPAIEEVIEEPAPEEPAIEEVIEESAPEEPAVEEVIEESAPEEPAVEEIIEELAPEEPAVEEVAEEPASEETEQEEELVERDFEILEEVSVAEAETFADEEAEQLIEVKVVRKKNKGKRGIVNLDSLAKHYEAGAHVTVESLREKGLIAKDVKVIKVLAKGSINKPLIVEADDFSLGAVKMIVLTGGRVIRRSSLD